MTDRHTRNLLSETHKEFDKAIFSLFKASIYLEEIDAKAFEKTLSEIKQTIKDLGNSSGSLIDFINEKDFPKTIDCQHEWETDHGKVYFCEKCAKCGEERE